MRKAGKPIRAIGLPIRRRAIGAFAGRRRLFLRRLAPLVVIKTNEGGIREDSLLLFFGRGNSVVCRAWPPPQDASFGVDRGLVDAATGADRGCENRSIQPMKCFLQHASPLVLPFLQPRLDADRPEVDVFHRPEPVPYLRSASRPKELAPRRSFRSRGAYRKPRWQQFVGAAVRRLTPDSVDWMRSHLGVV